MTKPDPKKPTLWQMMVSVMAAFFGVQSDKSRERDFTHGNPWVFIVMGLVFVIVFVLVLVGFVQLILHLTARTS